MLDDIVGMSVSQRRDKFEAEFKRIYSDLYPNEDALRRAIEFYREQVGYMQLADVNVDTSSRIEYLNYWLVERREENLEGPPNLNSSYTFKDIKKVLVDGAIDLVYLSPAVVTTPFFSYETFKLNAAKCVCGLSNNGITIGNFAKVLWQGGGTFIDAVADGLVDHDDRKFVVFLDEPTYNTSILLITDTNQGEWDTMRGQYQMYLGERGIGIGSLLSPRNPKIPGFHFVGENHKTSKKMGYLLDTLILF